MSYEHGDISYEDMGICPECHEHCEFVRYNDNGDEMKPDDEGYDEAESTSECCGA